LDLGIGICYPHPDEIGADRLANAVACAYRIGHPAIVVDFGTAVTFDVLSAEGNYLGGVIAPGLPAMTDYLHEKTALLPRVELIEPPRAVGRSTEEAMLAGAVHGYRGLIREIVARIREEAFGGASAPLVATGGHAELIGSGFPLFDHIDPLLTLRGLLIIAQRNHRASPGK
jgi:type III pantothenate kinase